MGEPRKRAWKSGCGSDASKRVRHGSAFGAASSAKGSAGILVTCDKTKEKQSVKDILNVLNEVCDEYFPVPNENPQAADDDHDDDNHAESVQSKLQQEIQQLQTASAKRQTGRFVPLDTGVKGVFLVQFSAPSMDPLQVVSKVFEQIEITKEFGSRFVQRLIPLQEITYASIESIQTALKPLVAHAFADEQGVVSYCVEVKRRNCSNLSTMDVINGCVALVDAQHKVNLTTPQLVIVVEIFRSTCGVSVVTNFHRTRRFNVRSVLDPPPSGKTSMAQPSSKDVNECNDQVPNETAQAATE